MEIFICLTVITAAVIGLAGFAEMIDKSDKREPESIEKIKAELTAEGFEENTAEAVPYKIEPTTAGRKERIAKLEKHNFLYYDGTEQEDPESAVK